MQEEDRDLLRGFSTARPPPSSPSFVFKTRSAHRRPEHVRIQTNEGGHLEKYSKQVAGDLWRRWIRMQATFCIQCLLVVEARSPFGRRCQFWRCEVLQSHAKQTTHIHLMYDAEDAPVAKSSTHKTDITLTCVAARREAVRQNPSALSIRTT